MGVDGEAIEGFPKPTRFRKEVGDSGVHSDSSCSM